MPQKRTNVSLAEVIRRAINAYLTWDDPNYHPFPMPQTRNAFHLLHE